MRLSHFRDRIIDDAAASAFTVYAGDIQKRDGFLAGLEACRDKSPGELAEMLVAANTAMDAAQRGNHPRQGEAIAFRAAVLWVCECVSCAMADLGREPLLTPGQKAHVKAAQITSEFAGHA
jgi:hypothetical protein